MPLDIDTYIRTKDLTGGPIIAAKHDVVETIEPITDESGNVRWSGMTAYLIAYASAAAALAYWLIV